MDLAAQPWKPTPWSSQRTVLELISMPHEVWRSVVIDTAESWWPLCTMILRLQVLDFIHLWLWKWLNSRIQNGWVNTQQTEISWLEKNPNQAHECRHSFNCQALQCNKNILMAPFNTFLEHDYFMTNVWLRWVLF